MVKPLERPSYFSGQFPTTRDYTAEQNYLDRLRAAHDAGLHVWGIASGLEVALVLNEVLVSPGVAVASGGRAIVAAEEMAIARPNGAAVLVLELKDEVEPPRDPAHLPRVREQAEVVWKQAAKDGELVLAQLADDGTLDASVRRYVGLELGALAFVAPGLALDREPSIIGWAAGGQYGLRIGGDEVRFLAMGNEEPVLSVAGPLGVGTMNPRAALDVRAPNSAIAGPGTITSRGTLVSGSDPSFASMLAPGETILTVDRQGLFVESKVEEVLTDGRVRTATSLEADGARWEFVRRLVLRLAVTGGEVCLSGDEDANVGLGTDFPTARLDVRRGDVELIGDRRVILAGDGELSAGGDAHRISFDAHDGYLHCAEAGPIRLVSGTESVAPSEGLYLSKNGDVGLGTMSPANKLVVEGAIRSTSGGFVFPDGSVQTSAQVSVPVGAVINFFRADPSIPIGDHFRICDGSRVEDPESPFYGYELPNLADRFIRGARDLGEIGSTGGSNTHDHKYTVPGHTHQFPHIHPDYSGYTGSGNVGDGNSQTIPGEMCTKAHVHGFTTRYQQSNISDTGDNSTKGKTETTEPAPRALPWFGLLKIIRIK